MIPARFTPERIAEYTRKGYWRPITFSHYWDRNALMFPDKEALVDSTTRLTWAEAKRAIDRIALGLVELGIERNEVALVQLPMSAENLLLRTALEKAGIIHLPVVRSYRHQEMEHFAQRIDAMALFIPWKLRGFDHFHMAQELRPNLPKLRHIIVAGNDVPQGAISLKEMMATPLEQKYPPDFLESWRFQFNELSWMISTSGTTGTPKLIEHAPCHRVYQSEILSVVSRLTGDDVTAVLSPAPTGPNNPAMFQAPMVGAKIVMLELWEPEEALKLIEKEKVTVFGATPAQVALMLNLPNFHRYNVSSMRLITTTGSPLPYQIARESEKKFGCPIINIFGTAEVGGMATFSPMDAPFEQRVLTVGQPMPGNEVRLVDDAGKDVPRGEIGEVLFRGATIAPGFYNDPQRNKDEYLDVDWLKTGDQGKWDEHGNLMIVGRIKDIIKRAGQSMFPGEVENILFTHPRIAQVAVVGMPDPVLVEKACAYVVPKPGATFTFEEMTSFFKGKGIASFKIPERLEIVSELPLVLGGSSMPKIDKKALRADITAKLKKEGKISE
jgi:non-ribosomal peptide synthetase component E (peptide arylation enzyme)